MHCLLQTTLADSHCLTLGTCHIALGTASTWNACEAPTRKTWDVLLRPELHSRYRCLCISDMDATINRAEKFILPSQSSLGLDPTLRLALFWRRTCEDGHGSFDTDHTVGTINIAYAVILHVASTSDAWTLLAVSGHARIFIDRTNNFIRSAILIEFNFCAECTLMY